MSLDYGDLGEDGKKPEGKPGEKKADLRWWTKTGQACANSISQALHTIDHAQRFRMTQLVTDARLYGNTPFPGTQAMRLTSLPDMLKERLHYNAIQSVIDTAIARLTRDKPSPYHLTSGGDYHTQRKAQKLNELRDGIFLEQQT